ncbi:hypothetical protein LB456_13230 [Psychroflexus sp. CAK57W]|uniref:hypothetical protein n=1 Tax=Psychroflexus curvus TaxID=2873595 RepID=UPI001CC9D6AF|nr:hypothetical protein [Psychroflexus curvus]MBZ9628385.1 hypothetical protein [Psychroflexus curvus]MBZ9788423.1 hypothetical protein [Psychroflexus curvus]
MIKFFRNIRNKLIEQDNRHKYLHYVISEILLVALGILITENLTHSRDVGTLRKVF